MRKNPISFDAIKSLKPKRPSTAAAKKASQHSNNNNNNNNSNSNQISSKPAWDSTVNDLNAYKLSRAEQVCKF